MQTLFNAPYPLRLTAAGKWVVGAWVVFDGLLFALALAVWLR